MRWWLIISLLILATINANGQNRKIDSLWTVFKNAKNDTTRIRQYLEIGKEYQKENLDSALSFYKNALNLSEKVLSTQSQNKEALLKLKATSLLFIGEANRYRCNFDVALEYYQQSLEICEKINNKQGICLAINYIGATYLFKGQFDKAFENLFKANAIAITIDDKSLIALTNSNIGLAYMLQHHYNLAIEYFLKAIKYFNLIHDKKRIAACYNNLGFTYSNLGNKNKAIVYIFKAIEFCEEEGNKMDIAKCYLTLGMTYLENKNFEKAILYNNRAISKFREIGDSITIVAVYLNIGNIHLDQGRYEDALKCFFKSLKITEELGNKLEISHCYTLIGNVYYNQGNSDRALEFHLKSLKISEELNDKAGIGNCYNNIGNVYEDQAEELQQKNGSLDSVKSKLSKANEYHLKSLKIKKELNDKAGMAGSYNNIGVVYQKQGNYKKAIEFYIESLKLNEELENKSEMARVNANISDTYVALTEAASTNSEGIAYLKSALEYGHTAFKLASEIKVTPLINEAAHNLMKAYNKLGNYKKAMEYAEVYMATKDSLFSVAKNKEINGLQLNYERDKNLKEKVLFEKDKTIALEQAKKQKIIITSISIGLGLLVFMVTFILRRLQITRRQKKIIEENNTLLHIQKDEILEKNKWLDQLNEEIASQRDNLELVNTELTQMNEEILTQSEELESQRDRLAKQHKEITESVVYASQIQRALLSSDEIIASQFPDHFILYRPSQIVSGDFYWFRQFKNIMYIVAADCTGHGIPGAFMSVLGMSLLNEIVGPRDVNPPHEILNELRKRLKKSLHQRGIRGEHQDGMDIALCMIDLETHVVQFAGAYNPFYLVRNNELIEYKGDRMPIGVHPKDQESFTSKEIVLQKDDNFYIFSDGYISQFGGEEGDKFKARRFKETLLNIKDKPMKEQYRLLDETYTKWQGSYEQVDDLLVIGVKINNESRG
jgi:tetratricopeptide (TPR) repeat protein/serine phosphatase RsbU (regulator of sigma subunit)